MRLAARGSSQRSQAGACLKVKRSGAFGLDRGFVKRKVLANIVAGNDVRHGSGMVHGAITGKSRQRCARVRILPAPWRKRSDGQFWTGSKIATPGTSANDESRPTWLGWYWTAEVRTGKAFTSLTPRSLTRDAVLEPFHSCLTVSS